MSTHVIADEEPVEPEEPEEYPSLSSKLP